MVVATGVVITVEAAVDTEEAGTAVDTVEAAVDTEEAAVDTEEEAVDTEEVAVDITEVEAGLLTITVTTQITVVKVIKATRDIMVTKRVRKDIMTKVDTVAITAITVVTRRATAMEVAIMGIIITVKRERKA
jgi:hypothetical protein